MTNKNGFTLIELLMVIAIIGIIAAIAIPSLLRARVSANEAQAIGDSRTVVSAEQSYASANGGFFADLTHLCRSGPDCAIGIPAYPTAAPEFLGGDLGRTSPFVKSGYSRSWMAVGGVAPGVTSNHDPNSVLDYCYMSTPNVLGLTGVRSFTTSAAGAVHLNVLGGAIPCPIPVGTGFLE